MNRINRVSVQKWLPVVGLSLAFWLRCIELNSRPIWYDEAFAILFSGKGFRAMLAGTLTTVQGAAADVHPIAYYTALDGWMQVFGQSPLSVRLLSVFASLLTVAVAYGIVRRAFWSKGTAIAGMFLVACLPFLVDYGQEARMYAPLALFCSLVIWFFLGAIGPRPTKANGPHTALWNWVGLSLSAAAAMYMQNLAGVFLLAFGLSTLPRPKVFVKVALAGAGAFVLWLPWFLNLPGQLAKLQQAYWVTAPNWVTLLQTLLVFHAGEELLETRLLLPAALFISIVLPIMLGFQLVKARKSAGIHKTLWLLGLAFGTPAVLFLVSLYQPVYIQRVLLPAGGIYAMLLGWLFWPPAKAEKVAMPGPVRAILAAGLAIVVISGLIAHYTFAQFPRPDFATVDNFLQQNIRPGDVVVHSNKLSYLPMYYYNRSLPQVYVADPPGNGSDTLALPTQQVLGLLASPTVETAADGADTVWFVIFDRARQEYAPAEHPQLIWLTARYTLVQTYHFQDLSVDEFKRNAP